MAKPTYIINKILITNLFFQIPNKWVDELTIHIKKLIHYEN